MEQWSLCSNRYSFKLAHTIQKTNDCIALVQNVTTKLQIDLYEYWNIITLLCTNVPIPLCGNTSASDRPTRSTFLSCTCMISYQQYDTDSILQLTSTNTAKLVIRTILTHHNKRNNPSNAPTNTRWCLWRMVYQQYIILYPVYHHDVQAPTGTDKDTELSIGSLQNEEQRNS
jgi:hypothetical protein